MNTKEAKQSVQMDKALFDFNAFYYRGRRSRSFTGRFCDSYSGSACDVCIDDIDSVISVY